MEIITSRKNPLAVHLKKLGSDSGYRHDCGQMLCDGTKLLFEAVKSGAEIEQVFTAIPLPFTLPDCIRVFSVPHELIGSISPLKNAQEVLFSCRVPEIPEFCGESGTHILLDGIQDPGNLGTIIRTADAFGIEGVILNGNCADPYNPKVIRATMGAVFRQQLYRTCISQLHKLVKNGTVLKGASADTDSRDISGAVLHDTVIAVGSEGRGLSEEIFALCAERVKIPVSDCCESLNAAVAASIIMWEVFQNKRYL